MAYVPKAVPQRDGSYSQWQNCWAAVGGWLFRAATRGKMRPTPTQVRRWSRVPPRMPGGLGPIRVALERKGLWGKRVWSGGRRRPLARYLHDRSRAKMRQLFLERPKGGGRIYMAESDFEVWPVRKRCSRTFGNQPNAYHSIGIAPGEGKGVNKGKVRVMNPLCHRMTWVDVDRVIEAIVHYNDEHSGEKKGTADLIVINVPDREET